MLIVCAGMFVIDDEFIFVSYIVFVVGFIVHIGESISCEPMTCAHAELTIPTKDTYVGNLILNLAVGDNGSLIVTLIVYEVTLLTTSVPLLTNTPLNTVDTAVRL